MVLPTFRVSLFSSIKPFSKQPHRHIRRCTAMVTWNLLKLTMKMDYIDPVHRMIDIGDKSILSVFPTMNSIHPHISLYKPAPCWGTSSSLLLSYPREIPGLRFWLTYCCGRNSSVFCVASCVCIWNPVPFSPAFMTCLMHCIYASRSQLP